MDNHFPHYLSLDLTRIWNIKIFNRDRIAKIFYQKSCDSDSISKFVYLQLQFFATHILLTSQNGFSDGVPGPQSISSAVQTILSGQTAWHSSVHFSTHDSLPNTRLLWLRNVITSNVITRICIIERFWHNSETIRYFMIFKQN